jgi:hypothetical protein
VQISGRDSRERPALDRSMAAAPNKQHPQTVTIGGSATGTAVEGVGMGAGTQFGGLVKRVRPAATTLEIEDE